MLTYSRNESRLAPKPVTHAIEEAALLGRKILLLNEPPNRAANVIENPGAGSPGYRESGEYVELCRELRGRMQ